MSDNIKKAVDLLIDEYNKEVNESLKTEVGIQEAMQNPEQFLDGIANKLKEAVMGILSERLEETIEQKLLQIWRMQK